MKLVILDAYTTNPGDLAWDFLREFGEYTVYDRTVPDEVLARAADCEIIITNKTALPASLLAQLPKLRFVGMLSTGYNVVDVDFAKERGVLVANIPTYGTAAVAQLTFALLLELTNGVGLHSSAVHDGEWTRCADFCFWKTPLVELFDKTMGIIGFGKIGQAAAKIALAFGMRVLAVSDVPPPETGFEDVEFCTLDEMLPRADAVTLHVPLTPQTEGLVDAAFLQKMKASAYLINTARGPIVKEQDLADALDGGIIAGAGLDVLCVEPAKAENPLLHCKNCFITPHIAWAGFETRQRLLGVLTENLRGFVAGKPVNLVN